MLIVFRKENGEYDQVVHKAAAAIRDSIITTYADMNSEANKRMAEYFGLAGKKQPFLFIADSTDGDMKKYVGPNEVTVDSIQDFVHKWVS
jgi:hypothetical protein